MSIFEIKVLMSYYNSNVNYVSGLLVFCFVGAHIKNHGLRYGMLFLFSCLLLISFYVIRHLIELCDKSGYLI